MSHPHDAHPTTPGTAKPGAVQPGAAKAQRPQAVAGPFTLRDLVVGGSVFVMLVGSLIPYFVGPFNSQNMWNTLPLFFLGIGILLPLAVVGLFAGRRLSPSSRIRVGSLSLDQFASIIAVLAVAFFFLQTASAFTAAYLVGLIGALGFLAATTLGRFIPPFAADFAGRKDVPAHVTARDAVAPAPKPAKPAAPATPSNAQGTSNVHGASNVHGTSHGTQQRHPVSGGPGAGVAAAGAAGAAGAGAAVGGPAASTSAPAEAAGVGEGSAQDIGAGAVDNGRGYTEASDVQVNTPKDKDVKASSSTVAAEKNAPVAEPRAESAAPVEPATSANPAPAEPSEPVEPAVAATAVHPVVKDEPISATRDQEDEDEGAPIEAFWFAVGSTRPIIDESTGKEIFTFEPGDWELCLEDRGHEFVVQNKHTGQTGIMKDLSDIQIPPAEDSDSARN